MRATLFKEGLEFKLEITGERWIQGQNVEGELSIKNLGNNPAQLKNLSIRLAWGDFKKVKSRDAKAFQILDTHALGSAVELKPKDEKSWKWSFTLPHDCQITEKSGSLYILYGDEENPVYSGDLQLTIGPKELYLEIIKLMENFMRFKLKDLSSKKGLVQAKFQPPQSKEFAALDGLQIGLGLENQELNLSYEFKVKKINLSQTNTDLKMAKDISKLQQKWDPRRYLIGQSIDQDFALKQLQAALESVKTKSMF